VLLSYRSLSDSLYPSQSAHLFLFEFSWATGRPTADGSVGDDDDDDDQWGVDYDYGVVGFA